MASHSAESSETPHGCHPSHCCIVAELKPFAHPDFSGCSRQCVNAKGGTLVSVRSLQRRLAEEGLTFSQLVDEVRLEMAVPQLRDRGIRITDVAFGLGYSNPAHFTRAFRRWAGVAPSEYRAHQLVS